MSNFTPVDLPPWVILDGINIVVHPLVNFYSTKGHPIRVMSNTVIEEICTIDKFGNQSNK